MPLLRRDELRTRFSRSALECFIKGSVGLRARVKVGVYLRSEAQLLRQLRLMTHCGAIGPQYLQELVQGHGMGNQKALHMAALQAAQHGQLLRFFHPLSHHIQAKPAAQGDDAGQGRG
ncbi:hypothetical protein D3C79_881880 [compost metagenome]